MMTCVMSIVATPIVITNADGVAEGRKRSHLSQSHMVMKK